MTNSIVKRRATDIRLGGAAGYALALQVGHPTIAAGVREHSTYATNPWGRFFGTTDFLTVVLYGNADHVAAATKSLRDMHAKIRGTDLDGSRYSALEPSAYAWVHGTLAESIVKGHHLFGTELTAPQKEAFWQEWLELGSMMGVRPQDLPDTWTGFQAYLNEMIDNVLTHNDVIEQVKSTASHATGGSPLPWLPPRVWGVAGRPLGNVLSFLGRGTMGPKLRDKFHMEWSATQEKRFRQLAAASRASGRVLPPPLRHSGPLILKLRKSEIAKGPFAA